jgi:hypothetical protein
MPAGGFGGAVWLCVSEQSRGSGGKQVCAQRAREKRKNKTRKNKRRKSPPRPPPPFPSPYPLLRDARGCAPRARFLRHLHDIRDVLLVGREVARVRHLHRLLHVHPLRPQLLQQPLVDGRQLLLCEDSFRRRHRRAVELPELRQRADDELAVPAKVRARVAHQVQVIQLVVGLRVGLALFTTLFCSQNTD